MNTKYFITLLLFLLVGMTGMAENTKNDDIRSGDALPNFSVQNNLGETISPTTLKGKPSLILFFHTDCWDCRKELPCIQRLYEKYGDQMEFIAISRAQSEENIAEYWRKNGISIPFVAQKDKSVFHLFARKKIPRIYVCNSEGIVTKTFSEKVKERRLSRAIAEVLRVEQ